MKGSKRYEAIKSWIEEAWAPEQLRTCELLIPVWLNGTELKLAKHWAGVKKLDLQLGLNRVTRDHPNFYANSLRP